MANQHPWTLTLMPYSESLNSATDKEVITISFGDIRNVKTYRGDKAIRIRFKDFGVLIFVTLFFWNLACSKIFNVVFCLRAGELNSWFISS